MTKKLICITILVLSGCLARAQTACLSSNICQGTVTATSTDCSVANSCVDLQLPNNIGSGTIDVRGTFSETIQFEVTTNSTNYANVNCTPPNSTTAVTSTTAAGLWQCNVAGYTHLRARSSAFTSGTATVTIQVSPATAKVNSVAPGGAVTSFSGDGVLITNSGSTGAVTATLGYTPTNAAVVPSTAPSAGQIPVGNAGGTAYAPTTTSGCTITSAGAVTCTPTAVGLSNVTNNAQTQSAVVPNTAPSAGQILVGNAGGTAYAPVSASQDCTISSTGAHTCLKTNNVSFGTAATVNTGTSGATIPLLNGVNTASGAWTFSAAGASSASAVNFTGANFVGSGTTSTPLVYINQGAAPTTWSTGTGGTLFGLNSVVSFTGNFIDFHLNGGASVFSVSSTGAVATSSNLVATGVIKGSAIQTSGNCASNASPAVCGSSASGSVAVVAGTNPTLQVNTSAVTANSIILLTEDESLGTKLTVTCQTAALPTATFVTARSAAASFTFQANGVFTTNPVCYNYLIIN